MDTSELSRSETPEPPHKKPKYTRGPSETDSVQLGTHVDPNYNVGDPTGTHMEQTDHHQDQSYPDGFPENVAVEDKARMASQLTENPVVSINKQISTAFDQSLRFIEEINSKHFNPKHAFGYNLATLLDDEDIRLGSIMDFKHSASVIDASAKLYTSRIDLAVKDSQKVLSALALASVDSNEQDQLDEPQLIEDRKKAKKKRTNKPTIVANIDSINGQLDCNLQIDPFLHHLNSSLTEGNASSLLMANLETDPMGVLLLDSSMSLNFSTSEPPKGTPLSVSDIIKSVQDVPFNESFVCKKFKDFAFSERDQDLDVSDRVQEEERSAQLHFNFDLNAGVEDVYDANFEDENRAIGVTGTNSSTDRDDNQQKAIAQIMPDIPDERLVEILPNNANKFFNQKFLKNICPSVSRLCVSKKNVPKKNEQPRQRRKHVGPPFTENKHYFIKSEQSEFKPCGRDNNFTVKMATCRGWIANSRENILPNETGFNERDLRAYFIYKSAYFYTSYENEQMNEELHTDNEVAIESSAVDHEEEMNKPNVSNDYEMESIDELEDNQQTIDHNAHHFGQFETPVDALEIDYATVAKKINIKKVKREMWSVIEYSKFNSQSEVDQPSSSYSSQTNALTFMGLQQTLSTRVGYGIAENLSTATSFVTLLHLCNEKTLALRSSDFHNSDFIIEALEEPK